MIFTNIKNESKSLSQPLSRNRSMTISGTCTKNFNKNDSSGTVNSLATSTCTGDSDRSQNSNNQNQIASSSGLESLKSRLKRTASTPLGYLNRFRQIAVAQNPTSNMTDDDRIGSIESVDHKTGSRQSSLKSSNGRPKTLDLDNTKTPKSSNSTNVFADFPDLSELTYGFSQFRFDAVFRRTRDSVSESISEFQKRNSSIGGVDGAGQEEVGLMKPGKRNSEIELELMNLQRKTPTNISAFGQTKAQEIQWSIWAKAIADFEHFSKNNKDSHFRIMIYNGIPTHFRAVVWKLLINVENSQFSGDSFIKQYNNLIKSESECEDAIRIDIDRTYPGHPDFLKNNKEEEEADDNKRDCLFHIIKVYSILDTEIGYCQGLCFIAGLLLMHLPEEDAFTIFMEIMGDDDNSLPCNAKKFNLRNLFKPEMQQVAMHNYIIQRILSELAPDLSEHLIAQGIQDFSSFASNWFLTIFTASFAEYSEWECCARIFDCFLFEGFYFLYKIALVILLADKEKLLELNMEEILHYLTKDSFKKYAEDPSKLLDLADHNFNQNTGVCKIVLSDHKIRRLEKEFWAIKSKHQKDVLAMRNIKLENQQLRARIEALEKENYNLTSKVAAGKWASTIARSREVKLRSANQSLRRQLSERSVGRKISEGQEEDVEGKNDEKDQHDQKTGGWMTAKQRLQK